ncbi:lytic transglycosylase catalytic [Serratia fonticola]|uniref:lytic transglycosylase catalytic n=1 Tax=Serratia fonticola TaxID=47917 RepID=UPI00209811F0|nr:lytic transglycosylase catalytic [Serratia fonticola]MCO7512716.1 lytic transglycosylase catalytic [Serratia fonticola]
MSNAETIKDFLISLGFDIDSAGEKKFSAVIAGVTANVLKLGAVVEGAALAVVGFTTQIANGLDKVYFASQRTGATVAGIRAIGYAAFQTGTDAAAAQGSLENLARFMRNSPGAEGFLNRLGVQTRGAHGQMRDTSAIFTSLGEKLSKMPTYRATQYAQIFGMDENTLLSLRHGITGFTADYQGMLKATGLDSEKAAEQSNKFMTSMRGLTTLLGLARDKIGSDLAAGLSGSLEMLRKRIMDNFPKIEQFITRVVKGILWLGEVFGRIAWRTMQAVGVVIDWWKNLGGESKKLLGYFGALLVGWRMLNSAFLMSPIGLITAAILAIALLIDDYMTWKEGGKSLIDWSKWEPGIKKAKEAIIWLRDKLLAIKDAVGGWQNVFQGLAIYLGGAWLVAMLSPIGKVTKALLAFPGLFKTALSAAGLYAVVAAIDEAYQRTRALINGEKYDQIPTQTEEMNELERLKRENWAINNPGTPYPEVAQHGQSTKGTLADRNNNPGNIRPVGGKGFRFFESAMDGWEAMKKQLMRYFTGKTTGKALQTISDIVSTWAPPSENDTGKYIADISKWMGVDPKAVLNLNNPQVMTSLMQSMARKEGYGNWNSPLAYKAAGGTPSIQQETNIHIHGVSDPSEAARLTADRQSNVNSQFTQQIQTGPK